MSEPIHGPVIAEPTYWVDGVEVSLEKLCRDEPEWAASRIRTMTNNNDAHHREVEEQKAEIARLRGLLRACVEGWNTTLEPLLRAIEAALKEVQG